MHTLRIALVVALGLAAVASPAVAHAPVKERTPKPGSTHAKVRTVSVRFGEAVVTGKIQVFRGSKEVKPKAAGLKAGNKALLRAVFSSNLPKGTYRVAWRALADDGHHEKGSWTFHVS